LARDPRRAGEKRIATALVAVLKFIHVSQRPHKTRPRSLRCDAVLFKNADRDSTHRMKRFQSIQIMRGIAASMVVLYHFGYSNSNFLAAFPTFGSLFRYGDLGVWMFFVISGFVIPYAMHSTN
jgi:hypothetical protein